MNKKTVNPKYEYKSPKLIFSQPKIAYTLKAGETRRGELYLGTQENSPIKGSITSSDRRLVPGLSSFSGSTVCLPYGIDCKGLAPGAEFSGNLYFMTNIGEYTLPVEIKVEKEQAHTSEKEITGITEFAQLAKEDFQEAFKLFGDASFMSVMKNESDEKKALYQCLSKSPVTYQNLEEFLIGMGAKQPVEITLKEGKKEFYDISGTVRETLTIQRSSWGHLRLEIQSDNDYIEIPKHIVTDDDFIGSVYEADVIIHGEKLGAGNRFAKIRIEGPHNIQSIELTLSAGPKMSVNMNLTEMKQRLKMLRCYVSYLRGELTKEKWMEEEEASLNILEDAGFDYPEYQMTRAYLDLLSEKKEEAIKILLRFQNKKFSKSELELAGAFLYLCYQSGIYKDRDGALKKIQSFYSQKDDSFVLLWILLHFDPAYKATLSRGAFAMETQFEKGCTSPVLYQKALEYVKTDMTILHRLTPFWTQVLLYAGKTSQLTGEIVMRLAYLSGYEKKFTTSLYRALEYGYEAFQSADTLEAICKYVMKGNPRDQKYFHWYADALNQNLRITRLYEYYVETIDTSYPRKLPRPVFMYFAYNTNTLGDAHRAFVYACVTSRKDADPDIFDRYRETMQTFAAEKIKTGIINENYAVLYQEFCSHPSNEEEAAALQKKLYTNRLYCDNAKIRKVIVRHAELNKEEVYDIHSGIAYPRIYNESASICFQDEQQRRFSSTIDYRLNRLMEEREILEGLDLQNLKDPGPMLAYASETSLTKETIGFFTSLAEDPDFCKEYRAKIRSRILRYYVDNIYKEDLDNYLRTLDYQEYIGVDKKALLEVLIDRHFFKEAFNLIEEYGYEGVEIPSLLLLASRLIAQAEEGEADDELLNLAWYVYQHNRYDENILHYLMRYLDGPTETLLSLWKNAKGFDMDTYEFEEKLLELFTFQSDDRSVGEIVLKSYAREAGKERVIGNYITFMAYNYFVKEKKPGPFIFDCLTRACALKWPVNRICRLACLKAMVLEKKSLPYQGFEEDVLKECASSGLVFSFFKKLESSLLEPYQLDDKTIIEYHTDPAAKVMLYYCLDNGLGQEKKYISEPLKDMYKGIYTRTFTIFYGETINYYFQVEIDGNVITTPVKKLSMKQIDDKHMSKYQMLNQILSARRLEKDKEAAAKLKKYIRQEQYVHEMFTLSKES